MPTADWYVDPLGRFEGRYFDGESWTNQVKDRGRLVIDPDWDRPDADPTAETNEHAERTVDEGFDTDDRSAVEPLLPALGAAEPGVPAVQNPTLDVEIPDAGTAVPGDPAAEPTIDLSTESPARQVAVLEPIDDAPELSTESILGAGEPAPKRRWLWLLGAAVLAAAVLIALLPRLFGGDDDIADDTDRVEAVADDESSDETDAADAAVDDADDADGNAMADDGDAMADDAAMSDEDGDAMADEDAASDSDAMSDSDSDAMADEDGGEDTASDDGQDADRVEADGAIDGSDSMRVGSLEILNGRPSLQDLSVWHASSLEGRTVELGDNAGCWFGKIGDAVVQNAHCGPVSTTPGAALRFDLVPLDFEQVDDATIQVRPVTDAVVIDAVLPNGVELVGEDGVIDLDDFERLVPGQRGQRSTGDG